MPSILAPVLDTSPGATYEAALLQAVGSLTQAVLGLTQTLQAQAPVEHPTLALVAADPPELLGHFRRDGGCWSIGFGEHRFALPDSKGLRYISYLLGRPGEAIHTLELLGAGEGHTRPAAGGAGQGDGLHRPGDGGEVLDGAARAAYRARLAELVADLDQAEAFADPERAAGVRAEMDFLACELRAAVGLGGRPRRLACPAERSRQSVTKAIKAARDRIAREDDALGRHLAASLRTGTQCMYASPARSRWLL